VEEQSIAEKPVFTM